MQLYLPIAGMSLGLATLLGLGLSVGILSGIFGVGGGFLLTPLLIVLGVPPLVAVGTGASIVVASSVSGTVGQWRRGNVDFALGLVLIGGGLAGSLIGGRLQAIMKSIGQLDLFTSLTYAAILIVIGTVMLVEGGIAMRNTGAAATVPARRSRSLRGFFAKLPWKRRFRRSKLYISVLPPLTIGAFVGLMTAVLGAGGGFILIPLLIYVLKLNTRVALGTSSFQVLFVAAFTTAMQAATNYNVDLMLGMPLMFGSVLGAQYGVRIGAQMKPEQLRVALAVLVLMVGLRMAADLTVAPADLFSIDVAGSPPQL